MSSLTNNARDKKRKKDRIRYTDEIVMWVTNAFILYLLVIYPLFMHNRYFDITKTKYLLFVTGVVIYSIVFAIAVLFKYLNSLTYSSGIIKYMADNENGKKCYRSIMSTDIWMALFFIAGVLAYIMADNKSSAFSGIDGRRCGLQFLIIVFIMYVCLSYGNNMKSFIMPTFAVASLLMFVLGIVQHLELDPFKLQEGLSGRNIGMFISTLGNINIYASFICISLPLFWALFIFETKLINKILYGAVILAGGASILTAGSDSVFAGIGVAVIVLLFVSIANDKKAEYFLSIAIIICGYILISLISSISGRGLIKISGFNKVSEHIGIVVIAFIIVLLLFVLCKLISSKGISIASVKVQMIFAALLIAIVIIVLVLIGIKKKWEIFVFDDNWGTYRGFVWKRLISIYNDFPIGKKLFGNGNESVLALMMGSYAEEMQEITGMVYDNAHNEYLQYLVTLGLFGLVSYLGVVVSTIISCVKLSNKEPVLYAVLAAVFAYCAQATFNINQAITTPFVFLFIGIASGIVRRLKNSVRV